MTRSSRRCLPLMIAISTLFCAGPSLAFGVGAYFEYLHGDGELDSNLTSLFSGINDAEFEADKFGVGFALDTNLAQNRLFNYRLMIGYQKTNRDFDAVANVPLPGSVFTLGNLDAHGFSFNSAFGFGLLRRPHLRLWAGPAIRLGVDVFDTNNDDIDLVDFSAGGGPVVGLNFHAGQHLTIGLTAGYQYLYVGEILRLDLPGSEDGAETFDGHEHIAMANITFFFRSSGDQFR